MKLATCIRCKGPILSTRRVCPKCGKVVKATDFMPMISVGVWVLAALILLSGLVLS